MDTELKNQRKCLLAVVAHPDDETFGMGGTLAYYARNGVQVNLICATRGEVGEVDEQYLKGFKSIGELREHELCCAADALGLKKVYFLGYRDSGMPNSIHNQHPDALINADEKEVAKRIAGLIREIQPQVVLTFDPLGGYMHPDHIAVHRATVEAYHMAGDPNIYIDKAPAYEPMKLYYHIMPKKIFGIMVKIMPLFKIDPTRFGKNKDIDLTAIISQNFPVHARINYRSVAALRDQASACHASQGGDRRSGYILNWLMRWLSSTELYMRAVPEKKDASIERDLFNGV